MIELIPSISNAITLVSKLRQVSDKLRDAEMKSLLADLSMELAEAKINVASLLMENNDLKMKIKRLESLEGDPCPRCRQRTWTVEKSAPDDVYGVIGGVRRTYRCSECDFTEDELIHPKK